MSYKISSPTYLYSLFIWLWWGTSIFVLIPHHQTYLQLLPCPAISIIAIHFCTVSPTLTSLGFSVFRADWPARWQSLFTRSLPLLRSLHWLPVWFRILFKINLLTYKILHEKQTVYLHSLLATSLPSRSLRSNNDNSLSFLRVKTSTGAFTLYITPLSSLISSHAIFHHRYPAIASCIFPFRQATLLQHWMVYNHAWLLSSHGCRQINWKWTQIKRNSSSLGMNGNGANIFLCFL